MRSCHRGRGWWATLMIIAAVDAGLSFCRYQKWRALTCHMLCISSSDAPASPKQREVVTLHLPVFDQKGSIRRPADGKRVGQAQQKEKTRSAGGINTATPFLLGEGLPPIPAKLVAKIRKGDFVDMAELLQDNIEADRRHSKFSLCSEFSCQQRWEGQNLPTLSGNGSCVQ